MTKPRAEVRQKEYRQKIKWLYQTLNKLGSETKVRALLADLLTPAEQRMVHRRWHVASLLAEGLNVREVARQAKVSTLTVMQVKKLFGHPRREGLLQAVRQSQKKVIAKRVPLPKEKPSPSRLVFGGGEKEE